MTTGLPRPKIAQENVVWETRLAVLARKASTWCVLFPIQWPRRASAYGTSICDLGKF